MLLADLNKFFFEGRTYEISVMDLVRRIQSDFDPVESGLRDDFNLLHFSELKGWGCKVPQEKLLKYLEALKQPNSSKKKKMTRYPKEKCRESLSNSCSKGTSKTDVVSFHKPLVDIGLDCAVIPLKHNGLVMVQTTDFFYPLVDDPYIQGRIACCNVLSDMYAVGVEDCDNMLMILGVPRKMSEEEREIVIPMMMKGFKVNSSQLIIKQNGGDRLQPWP